MALTKFTKDVSYHQKLSNRPNSTDGLTADVIKQRFDQGVNDVKDYINNTLTTEADSHFQTLDDDMENHNHDNRYYTKEQQDASDNAQNQALEEHKASGDHDDRYYTKTELGDTASEESGASKIGAEPLGEDSGNTTMSNMLWLKEQINTTAIGSIPDSSITDVKLSDDPTQIKSRFASHLIPHSTLHGDTLANIVSIGNTEKKAVAVGLKGRTVINLLGNIGDCENTGIWNITNQVTLSLDSTSKVFGSNSLKSVVATGYGEHYIDFYLTQKATKGNYYCFSVYVKPVVGKAILRNINVGESTTFLGSAIASNSSIYSRIFVKGRYLDDTTLLILRIQHLNSAGEALFTGSTEELNFDGIMVNEITEEEYNDANYKPPEYVNSDVSATNPVVKSCGKNLFDGIFESGSFADGNGAEHTDLDYKRNKNKYILVKANTQYVHNMTGTSYVFFYDKNKAFIGLATGSNQFVTPAKTTYINFCLNDLNNNNIQLEEGSVATDYEPYQGKEIRVPYTLRECGGARDEITKDGKVIGRIGYKVLDGSLGWSYSGGDAEYKEAYVNGMDTNVISGEEFCIKYNGKILPYSSEFVNDTVYYSAIGRIIVRIPNSDSGWGADYVPTTDEMKAYFYGWKMNNGTFDTLYNGTGTKTWTTMSATSNTGSVTTCPTTMATDGYTPYRLYYQLAQPEIEDIPPILLPVYPNGSISVDSNIMPLLNYELMDNARKQIDSLMDGLAGVTGSIMPKENVPMCSVYSDLAQSIPNEVDTKIVFNKVRTDTDNNADYTDRSKIKINTSGKYVISAIVNFAFHTGGIRAAYIAVNDNNFVNRLTEIIKSPDGSTYTMTSLSTIAELKAGDCISLWVYQNCGEAISIDSNNLIYTTLSIVKVGD